MKLDVSTIVGKMTVEGPGLREALLYHSAQVMNMREDAGNEMEFMHAMNLHCAIYKTAWDNWHRLIELADAMAVTITLNPESRQEWKPAAEKAAS